MLLTTLLTNCATTKTEYIERLYVPALSFPPFPAMSDFERKGGRVSVSEDWIVRLAEYKIRIEETEKNYNDFRALYEKRSAE